MQDEAKLREALARTSECADIDFKESFDPSNSGEWLEVIKDVVAMANTGGGTILIGVSNDGSPSGKDISAAASTDPADLTNKIHKYTDVHFHAFEMLNRQKNDIEICALIVGHSQIPIVFTKVGTYEVTAGKQKTVFSAGTVYFRHGAKSEPGTSEDLRQFLVREIELTKRSWMDGIAKIVEAPTGSRIAILPPEDQRHVPSGAMPLRLVDDPAAPAYYAVPIDTTHPFRQKEVVRDVNAGLAGSKVITSHNIVCIRRVYSVQKNITFCYTQNYTSPRYSQAFVDWIVSQYKANAQFFEETKAKFDGLKQGNI
jgi:hypothetical protein